MTFLPFEIITEILARLPVKPLMRFKSVSKPWKTLISSPKFIKAHLKQTLITNPNPENILVTDQGTLITAKITSDTNRNNLSFTELNHPLKQLPNRPDVGLLESCNGVLFIADYPNKETMFLYNPSVNSYCLIPNPTPMTADLFRDDEFFGFGYDNLNDDYKVVRLQQWIADDSLGREASVYSLRDNVWKTVKDETVPFFLQQSHGVAANEMVHFIGQVMKDKVVLKCFDLRTNALFIVDNPEFETNDLGKMSMSLRELRGRLCLLVSYRKQSGHSMRDLLHNRELKYADLWEMRERGKKESWVKLFRIRKSEIAERCGYLRLVAYSKDERSVLLEVNGKWFGWYDLVSKRMDRVAVQGLGLDDAPYVAMTFVESLVSVSNEKVALIGGLSGSNDKPVPKGRTRPPKNTEKSGFLSSGFKLKL